MDNTRQTGINMLATVMKNKKKCTAYEEYIYKHAEEIDEEQRIETYLWFVYQTVGMILTDRKDVKKVLKNGQLGWEDPCYETIADKLEEHDNYIVKPFEVVEGVVKCLKCGGKKTWSMQKQCRGGDEMMTTFSRCVTCGHKWKYTG